MRETFWSFNPITTTREQLVIRIRRVRNSGEHAGVTMCMLNYCPFCGVRVNREARPRAKVYRKAKG